MARYGWGYDRPGRTGPGRDNRGYPDGGYPGRYFGYGPHDGGGGYRADAYRYGADYGAMYDRDYKTRAQTDYGDPFDDRSRGVPFRVMQGEFHARDRGYDRGYRGDDRGFRDDRGFGGYTRNRYDRGGW